MNAELEDRLQAEMRHATAGARVPPDLARRAWRNRRRRVTTRAAAAAGTAAVLAAAAVAGTTGASRPSGIHTTAYIVKHVGSALSGAVAANDIMDLRAADGSAETWISSGPAGPESRTKMAWPPGQVYFDTGTNLKTDTVTGVNYRTKTWNRFTSPGPSQPYPPPTSCRQVGQPDDTATFVMRLTLATLAASIREALACGQWSSDGTQHVGGVDAIKLVSVSTVHLSDPTQHTHAPGETLRFTTTAWVDSASYLPLRWMQTILVNGKKVPGPPPEYNIQWLPPTSANLAQLTVPIPAGFTQAHMGVPIPSIPGFS
jgi:hypothetical protein